MYFGQDFHICIMRQICMGLTWIRIISCLLQQTCWLFKIGVKVRVCGCMHAWYVCTRVCKFLHVHAHVRVSVCMREDEHAHKT
jgi:hypothetical protein